VAEGPDDESTNPNKKAAALDEESAETKAATEAEENADDANVDASANANANPAPATDLKVKPTDLKVKPTTMPVENKPKPVAPAKNTSKEPIDGRPRKTQPQPQP
jgi:hypothetical protein